MTHVPIRCCCACSRRAPKAVLIRFRIGDGGSLELDGTGRGAGRGAYLCRSRPCWERALKKGSFARTLRTRLPSADYAQLAAIVMRELETAPGEGGEAVHE